MHFTYYGHSCFCVEFKGTKLLFDPFITPNELANKVIDVDAIQADYILLESETHRIVTSVLYGIFRRWFY
jgi:L-ascorbate metabolism protein UlaG (beta-lactamase superfamily)